MHALFLKGWSPLLPPLWNRTVASCGVATLCITYSTEDRKCFLDGTTLRIQWRINQQHVDWISFKLCVNRMIRMVCQNRLGVFSNPNCWYNWVCLGDYRLGGHACGMGLEWYVFDLGALVHWGWILWGLWCGGYVVGWWWCGLGWRDTPHCPLPWFIPGCLLLRRISPLKLWEPNKAQEQVEHSLSGT